MSRRVAAIVMPELVCELGASGLRPEVPEGTPLAALLVPVELAPEGSDLPDPTARVAAVNGAARSRGVASGMKVTEAMARTAALRFVTLTARALDAALGALAEVAMAFGPTVEIAADDTLLVDVTGVGHLFGGEEALAELMRERFQDGRSGPVRVALADGPFVARAVALHATRGATVVPAGASRRALAALPVAALPLAHEGQLFFGRVGVSRCADLMRLDRAQLAARLEAWVAPPFSREEILGLLDGRDARPLRPHVPAEVVREEAAFEDGVETAAQLLFAVRGMISRASQRLVGRRQVTGRIDLTLDYDRTIFRLSQGPDADRDDLGGALRVVGEPRAELTIELTLPLSHTDDLFRALKAKLDVLELAAPARRVALCLSRIQRAPEQQLDLSRGSATHPDALPALLAELSAELGPERVGVLALVDDLRPERRSALVGLGDARPAGAARRRAPQGGAKRPDENLALWDDRWLGPPEPTRILSEPVAVGPLASAAGASDVGAALLDREIALGADRFRVTRVAFDRRLDGVGWWTTSAAHRDYYRVELARAAAPPRAPGPRPGAEAAQAETVVAWLFVDRKSGEAFVQGFWE